MRLEGVIAFFLAALFAIALISSMATVVEAQKRPIAPPPPRATGTWGGWGCWGDKECDKKKGRAPVAVSPPRAIRQNGA
ncbi:hypothetical protein L1887_16308 [Cichorium endivia]|nr:hypothetical protein L1887_16308 [Cichorium endivia]